MGCGNRRTKGCHNNNNNAAFASHLQTLQNECNRLHALVNTLTQQKDAVLREMEEIKKSHDAKSQVINNLEAKVTGLTKLDADLKAKNIELAKIKKQMEEQAKFLIELKAKTNQQDQKIKSQQGLLDQKALAEQQERKRQEEQEKKIELSLQSIGDGLLSQWKSVIKNTCLDGDWQIDLIDTPEGETEAFFCLYLECGSKPTATSEALLKKLRKALDVVKRTNHEFSTHHALLERLKIRFTRTNENLGLNLNIELITENNFYILRDDIVGEVINSEKILADIKDAPPNDPISANDAKNIEEKKSALPNKITCLQTLSGHTETVTCILMLSDGLIASGSCDKTIKLWVLKNDNYQEHQTLSGHTDRVVCLAELPIHRLASGSSDGTIKLWGLEDGMHRELQTLQGYKLSLMLPEIKLEPKNIAFQITEEGLVYQILQIDNRIKSITIPLNRVPPNIIELVEYLSGLDARGRSLRKYGLLVVLDFFFKESRIAPNGHMIGDMCYINCLLVLKNENFISGGYCEIKLWSLENNIYRERQTLRGHHSDVTCLVELDDGRIVSGSDDDSIKLWILKNGDYQEQQTLYGHVSCLSKLSDGRLVSASDMTIKIWIEGRDHYFEQQILCHSHVNRVTSLIVLSDSRLMSAAGNVIKLWTLENDFFQEQEKLYRPDNEGMTSLVELSDSRFLSGSWDKTIKLWSMDESSVEQKLQYQKTQEQKLILQTLKLALLGEWLAAVTNTVLKGDWRIIDLNASYDRESEKLFCLQQTYQLSSRRKVITIKQKLEQTLGKVIQETKIAEDVKKLFLLHQFEIAQKTSETSINLIIKPVTENNIHVLSEVANSLEKEIGSCLQILSVDVAHLVALPDGQFASASNCGVSVWRFDNGYYREHQSMDHQYDWLFGLVKLSDNSLVSAGHINAKHLNTIKRWKLQNGSYQVQQTQSLQTRRGLQWVRCLTVLSDNRLISGMYDASIKIWRLENGNYLEQQILNGHKGAIKCVLALANGNLISCSEKENSIKVWIFENGNYQETENLNGHLGWVTCLAELSDHRIVSGSKDTSIKLWILENGGYREWQTLSQHTKDINCLVALSDGRFASGSDDCTIKLWISDNGIYREQQTFYGHLSYGKPCRITYLLELFNGNLASISSFAGIDNKVKIWKISQASLEEKINEQKEQDYLQTLKDEFLTDWQDTIENTLLMGHWEIKLKPIQNNENLPSLVLSRPFETKQGISLERAFVQEDRKKVTALEDILHKILSSAKREARACSAEEKLVVLNPLKIQRTPSSDAKQIIVSLSPFASLEHLHIWRREINDWKVGNAPVPSPSPQPISPPSMTIINDNSTNIKINQQNLTIPIKNNPEIEKINQLLEEAQQVQDKLEKIYREIKDVKSNDVTRELQLNDLRRCRDDLAAQCKAGAEERDKLAQQLEDLQKQLTENTENFQSVKNALSRAEDDLRKNQKLLTEKMLEIRIEVKKITGVTIGAPISQLLPGNSNGRLFSSVHNQLPLERKSLPMLQSGSSFGNS